MRKQLILFLFISFAHMLFGQDVINNLITEDYKNITGTKVSLIPPKGFTEASDFKGFQNQGESIIGSIIMILEMPSSFSEIRKTFTKESLLSNLEIEAKEIKELNINGSSAVLITGTKDLNIFVFSTVMLLIGNDEGVALINCTYPQDLPEMGDEIIESVLSVIYATDLDVDPHYGIDFSVDVDSTDLIFAMSAPNSLIYTLDGKIPTKSESKADLIITKFQSEVPIEDRKTFAMDQMRERPPYIEQIDSTNALTIDGISGYEIYAKGGPMRGGLDSELYQVILFTDDLLYMFFGSTSSGDKKTLRDMKRIVESFKRK